MRNNPYVGPIPFKRGQGDCFFGRDHEAQELLWLIMAEPLVIFYAQSGAGKTSLLNAKVIPNLEDEDFMVLPVTRVVGSQISQTDPEEKENIFVFNILTGLTENDASTGNLKNVTLKSYLSTVYENQAKEEHQPILVIIDQFEELFTAYRGYWKDIKGLFVQLREAIEAVPGLGVVLTLREDYIAGLDPYLPLASTQIPARFRMERLTESAAREAIERPARKAGCPFDEGAAKALVENLCRIKVLSYESDSEKAETTTGQYVEAVQLQVVCSTIWEQLPEHTTVIHQQDIGDVDQALTKFYEKVLANTIAVQGKQTEVGERYIRRWFESYLITPSNTRGLVMQGKEKTEGLPNTVIDSLSKQHLIHEETRAGSRWYELTHDRLIEPILESNATWREKQLQPFQNIAAKWHNENHPTHLLLDIKTLQTAEQWAAKHPNMMLDFELTFLTESREAHKRAEMVARAREAGLGTNLSDLGWGVIFAAQDSQASDIRRALGDLLDHRRRQAGEKDPAYFKVFVDMDGYRPEETTSQFLRRHGVGASVATPDKMPYNLLIVGSPQVIPYAFQYGLAAQYAVGRIYFEDVADYAIYAQSVVKVESGDFALPKQMVIFGPQNPKNWAMPIVTKYLTDPLVSQLQQSPGDWRVKAVTKDQATKAQLRELLGRGQTPALLFTSTFGLGLPNAHERQLAEQGALLCQEWPGGEYTERHELITPDHYFSAQDVEKDARLLGLVAFLLTNYSAGTPQQDNFAYQDQVAQKNKDIAPYDFMARLPQRLLAHPNGGALAVIGHVERVWTTSFVSYGGQVQESALFETVLRRLMMGHTVGSAMELFRYRYAQLSANLAEALQNVVFYDEGRDNEKLVMMMTQTIDARNYVIIGDPAIRLVTKAGLELTEHPIIGAVKWEVEDKTLSASSGQSPLMSKAFTKQLTFSGVNGVTGEYLLQSIPLEEIAEEVRKLIRAE